MQLKYRGCKLFCVSIGDRKYGRQIQSQINSKPFSNFGLALSISVKPVQSQDKFQAQDRANDAITRAGLARID